MDDNKEEIIAEKLYSEQDEQAFRKKAQKRVSFKIHFTVFILVNLLIWLFWFFIFSNMDDGAFRQSTLKTFFFISSVWSICMITHYLFIYKWNKSFVEKEIRRLKKEEERQQKELEALKEEQKNQSI